MELNKDNYYSLESDKEYISFSQIKQFDDCEAKAMAILNGEWKEEPSDAMLAGAYFDAHFSHELEQFLKDHPQLFKKDGTLLAKYDVALKAIKAVEEDELFHDKFFTGDTQTILTGEIDGLKFKGKLDYKFDDYTVDMKLMKDTKDIWVPEDRVWEPFYIHYGYHYQGAIYRELRKLIEGEYKPYFLAVVTKEDVPSKEVYHFNDDLLDLALGIVIRKAHHIQDLKDGKAKPVACGCCDYCKSHYKFSLDDIHEVGKEIITG